MKVQLAVGSSSQEGKRRVPEWFGNHRGTSPQFPSEQLGDPVRWTPQGPFAAGSLSNASRGGLCVAVLPEAPAGEGQRPASDADRLAPACPTPRGCVLPGRAGGDAPCPPGSGARAGVPATAQRVLQNTGSHVSLLSHRLKNEETLLDGKQGKKKRKKARMMCSWTTAPSQFMLGAKSTHRSLPIE